jgi:hypothetical protein
MEPETCAYCNGTMDKKIAEQKKYRMEKEERREYTTRRKTLHEESKQFALRHEEPYTIEELKHIIVNTSDISRRDLDILYSLAKKHQRRLGAIEWIHRKAWGDSKGTLTQEGLKDRIDAVKLALGI